MSLMIETTEGNSLGDANGKVVSLYYEYRPESMEYLSKEIPAYSQPGERLKIAIDISNNLSSFPGLITKPLCTINSSITEDKPFNPKPHEFYKVIPSNYERPSYFADELNQIRFAFLRDLSTITGFFIIKLKGNKGVLPVTLKTKLVYDNLRVHLYKEPYEHYRILDIPVEDIEEVILTTMVTLRGLQREIKKMATAVNNLDTGCVEFNPDLI